MESSRLGSKKIPWVLIFTLGYLYTSALAKVMAARKTTTSKKTSPKKKTTKETSPSELAESKVNPTQDFLKKVKIPSFLRRARNIYFILGFLVLVSLGFLASKYLVVAWVDKIPVTAFEYYKILDQKFGKEVKEQLIVEQLINNEAVDRGISITEDEINKEIVKVEKEQGGKEGLQEVLNMNGISQDEFKKLVRLQLVRQKMFGQNINITDEEVNKFIVDNKEQYPTVNDEVKKEVKESLRQQKVNQDFQKWLSENLQGKRVTRN